MKIIKKTRWLKIKGENEKNAWANANEKNAWANAFKTINQMLHRKYKKKRMKLVKES